jgi:hypothetical protein
MTAGRARVVGQFERGGGLRSKSRRISFMWRVGLVQASNYAASFGTKVTPTLTDPTTSPASHPQAMFPKPGSCVFVCLVLLLAVGCRGEPPERGDVSFNPDTSQPSVTILPITVRDSIASVGGVTLRNGGFGSGISRGPDGYLYILTDRGPNYDCRADQGLRGA